MTDLFEAYCVYRADLEQVLMTGNWRKLKRFLKRRNIRMRGYEITQPPDELIELTMHKTITGITSLPIAIRRASKQWLIARGYHALDDGDV